MKRLKKQLHRVARFMVYWLDDKIMPQGKVGTLRLAKFEDEEKASKFARKHNTEVLPLVP